MRRITIRLGGGDSKRRASSVLTLTDLAVGSSGIRETLTLAETLTASCIRPRSDTIVFTDSATVHFVTGPKFVTETITLVETLSPQVTYNVSRSDSITFAEVLYNRHLAADTITFAETLSGFLIHRPADTITFTELASFVFVAAPKTINESLPLIETLSPQVTYHLAPTDTVVFTTRADHPNPIHDTLIFSETLKRVRPATASDGLVLVETLAGSGTSPRSDALVLVETLNLFLTARRTFTDALSLVDSAYASKVTAAGSTSSSFVCQETYAVTLAVRNKFTLTFPYVSPSLTLDLPTPKFGNVQHVVTGARTLQLRSGKSSVFKYANWPSIETFSYTFHALNDTQRAALIDFLKQSAALEIGILDHENRQFRGVITSPTNEIIQAGPMCEVDTGFEFQGRLA